MSHPQTKEDEALSEVNVRPLADLSLVPPPSAIVAA